MAHHPEPVRCVFLVRLAQSSLLALCVANSASALPLVARGTPSDDPCSFFSSFNWTPSPPQGGADMSALGGGNWTGTLSAQPLEPNHVRVLASLTHSVGCHPREEGNASALEMGLLLGIPAQQFGIEFGRDAVQVAHADHVDVGVLQVRLQNLIAGFATAQISVEGFHEGDTRRIVSTSVRSTTRPFQVSVTPDYRRADGTVYHDEQRAVFFQRLIGRKCVFRPIVNACSGRR